MKKFLPIIIAAFILLLILIVGIFTKSQLPATSQNTSTPATAIAPQPLTGVQTVLSLLTVPIKNTNGTYQMPVLISTGNNAVTAVQLIMQYDPKILGNVNVTVPSNGFFASPTILLNTVNTIKGTINFAVVLPVGQRGKKGTGMVALLTFTEIGPKGQMTKIFFLPNTQVTAEGYTTSVLKSTTGAAFSF